MEQVSEALARVHPPDRQHDRPVGRPALGDGEAALPSVEVDRLGHDGEPRARDAVLALRGPGGVLAGDDDPVGARDVQPFPSRLAGEQRPHQSALVPRLVGDDPLEAHDERPRTAAGPQETIEVDADDHVRAGRRERDAHVIEVAIERVEARAQPEGPDLRRMPERGEPGRERVDADEGAAAFRHRERGGRQEDKPH